MRIFNIMMSRNLNSMELAFLDYTNVLKKKREQVINITSSYAKINKNLPKSRKLPNLFRCCIFSKLYLRILIAVYKPDILLAHGSRAIFFSCGFFKPSYLPLIGISHTYKVKPITSYYDYIVSAINVLMDYLVCYGIRKNIVFPTQLYEEKLSKKPLIIGSLGCFLAKNGFNYLLKAAALLKYQGYNIKLIIGEAGEEEAVLKNLVRKLNLVNEVIFFKRVKNKEKFLERINIFCLPSTSKSFYSILVEAIEHSTPILTANQGKNFYIANNNYLK